MELAFISAPDLALVFIVALVVFGPKRLPEVGRQLGHMVRDLRKVTGEFTDIFHDTREDFRQVVTISDPPAVSARALDQRYENGLMDRSAKLGGPGEEGGQDDALADHAAGMVVSTVPPSEGEGHGT